MDGCNAHVGQGFDDHYHGDPSGGNSTTCLYSAKNYTSVDAHPPFIGYSLDGFPIHGRHLSRTATGASTTLDDCALLSSGCSGACPDALPLPMMLCHQPPMALVSGGTSPPPLHPAGGGHTHTGVAGYHYHAQLVAATSAAGVAYTAYVADPYKCWKGDISKLTNFWDLTAKPTATAGYGASPDRTDYEQLRPCCGSANYYAASGYSINGAV